MNKITKRVPRNPDEHQMQVARETVEGLGFEWTAREIQLAKSLYAGMVSAAPVDPMEAAIERKYQREVRRSV